MMQVPIALQLYTVRDQTAQDFPGTVRQVAEMGYAGVEFAGTGGLSAEALRDLLAETGLKPAGNHTGIDQFEQTIDQVIAFNQTIGNKFVGVPYMPKEYQNPAGFRWAAATMNRIGAQLKQAGMVLYYHNHAFEFDVVDGERGIDILYKETDPDLVKMEIDVYWVHYGGEDPAALMRANSGRFPLIHLKDMTVTDDKRTFTEVGEGIIDFQPIFAAAEAQGAEWYIVEQDICARPSLESARLSLENLKKWGKA